MVRCGCGKEAPVVLITEREQDEELRRNYLGKKIVRCVNCMTATEVTEKLQAQLDVAERIGELTGKPPLIVNLVEDSKKEKSPIVVHGNH